MKINYTAPRSGSLFKSMCNYLLCIIIQSIIFMACRKLNRLHFEVACMNMHGWLNSLLVHDCLLASLLVLPLVRILRYSKKQASELAHDYLKLELFLQEARYIATCEFFSSEN